MLGENHDLFHELPEYVNRINQLKVSNDSFAQLFEEYHQVNREVERIEEVGFNSVIEILPLGVAVASGAFIPYHRIVAVRRGEEALWRKGRR